MLNRPIHGIRGLHGPPLQPTGVFVTGSGVINFCHIAQFYFSPDFVGTINNVPFLGEDQSKYTFPFIPRGYSGINYDVQAGQANLMIY